MSEKFHLYDTVLLPKGLRVGMGRLKEDIEGMVVGVQLNDRGEEIYRISYEGHKGKKTVEKSTWVSASDVELLQKWKDRK